MYLALIDSCNQLLYFIHFDSTFNFLSRRKLLTKQQHYDWGLRALKTVLGGCGRMLKAARKNLLKEGKSLNSALEEDAEREVVVQALRLNTLSKLTFADCARFDSLVRDVFPGVRFTSSGYEELTAALKESFGDLGLLCNENQVRHIFLVLQ
jgi:dynein heavy chain 2